MPTRALWTSSAALACRSDTRWIRSSLQPRSSGRPAGSCQQAAPAVVGGSRIFYGIARHDDSEYRGAGHLGGAACGSAEHEVGAGQLYAEPGGFHPHQRLDGGPVWDPPSICLRDRPFHAGIISLRHIEQHSSAGRLPHTAGLRRSHDGTGRQAHPGANVCQIRIDPRHELCRDSRFGWPHAGTHRGRSDRRLLSLAIYLLREYTHRPFRSADGLHASARLSRRANPSA